MLRYFFLSSYHMLQSKLLEGKKNDNDRIDLDMLFILILAIFLILFLLPFATISNVINTACLTCNHFLETSSFPVKNRLLYCFIFQYTGEEMLNGILDCKWYKGYEKSVQVVLRFFNDVKKLYYRSA